MQTQWVATEEAGSQEGQSPSWRLARLCRVLALLLLVLLYVYWLHPLLLLPPGTFIRGHSPLYDVLRSVGVIDAWRSGILDARVIPAFDEHYGYPILGLYAPMFFWTGAVCILVTGSWQWGITLSVIAWLACGLVGVFLAARQVWSAVSCRRDGFWAGWLACVGWLIFPYIAFNIYVRTDGGEFAASMMLPWILWAGMRLLGSEGGRRQRARLVVPFAGSMAVAILSHNVYGLYCMGYALAIPLLCLLLPAGPSKGRRRWLLWGNTPWYLLGVSLGLGLSLFFWLPAMVEMHYTHVYTTFSPNTTRIQRSLLTLRELVAFETVVRHTDYQGPVRWVPQLGWVCAASALSALGAAIVAVTQRRWPLLRTILVLAGAALASAWFLTVYSRPFWLSTSMLRVTQFAWRMSSMSGLALCLLLPALLIAVAPLRDRLRHAVLLIGVLVLAGVTIRSLHLYVYRSSMPLPDAATVWNGRVLTANKDEYATIWRQKAAPRIWPAGEVLPEGPIQVVGRRGQFNRLRLSIVNPSQQPGSVQVAYNYFPGWYAYTKGDGRPLAVGPGDRGIIRITQIPPGAHTVRLAFGNTPLRLTCKLASGGTALLLLAMAIGARASKR